MNLIQLTEKLVSLPSYVNENSNEVSVADFLFSYLKTNLPWFKLEKQYISKNRYNIIAVTSNNPKIIFISHMDTVLPNKIENKKIPTKIINNKIIGLGACDMKAGLAASLFACQQTENKKNLGLIFDCDEEYYFKGIKKLINQYKFKPELIIFPEPTNLEILNGCRGLIEIQFDLIGKTAHASNPDLGINAIEKAVDLIRKLKQLLPKETSVNLSTLKGGKLINNQVETQANAIPDLAKLLLDIRINKKSLNAQKIFKILNREAKKMGLIILNKKINLDYPPFKTKKDFLLKIEKIILKSQKIIIYSDINKSGFFEASFVSKKWNCPVIAFGPGPQKMAHQKNEYVNIKDLIKTKNIFQNIIKDY